MQWDKKKIVGAVLGVVLGLAVAWVVPSFVGEADLPHQGVLCLAILLWAIVWWIAAVLPEYVTAILMVLLFCVVAGVPTSTSLAAFSTSTWWLLVAAFSLGAGLKVSGLMRRMALSILRLFPQSYAARVGGLMAVGTLLGPLIPSLAAKTSMITPLAMTMGDAAGYPRKGKQMQGLFLAMLTGVRNVAPAVISASIMGYALWGLYPQEVQGQFDMLHWFLAALPWFAVVTVLNYGAICLLYGPKRGAEAWGLDVAGGATADVGAVVTPGSSSPDGSAVAPGVTSPDGSAVAPGVTSPAFEKPGPLSRQEKQMALIMVATVLLWVTEPLHGIASHVVALGAMAVMLACGILGKADFRSNVAWESLVFIGCVIGLASVFSAAGIQDWIIATCGPLFQTVAANPFALVAGIGIMTVLLRFVIVSEMAYINIAMVFMIPLAVSCGINPWVVGMAVYAMVNPWFMLYQNPVYLAAFYSVDGQMVNHGDMARYCLLYVVICLVGLVVSVPYWQMLGFFG